MPEFTRKLASLEQEKQLQANALEGRIRPYKIWLSEVMLQQTRVEQGWAYYEKFIKAFPTIHKLASAPDEKVFKMWEGLGYYSRCKNLLATARFVSAQFNGKFPVLMKKF